MGDPRAPHPARIGGLRRRVTFDTVLGRIAFDAKGDVTGYETFVWYVWKDGRYTPVEPGKLTE